MNECALYIHIPFCARKCAYCDFASFPDRKPDWPAYLSRLEEEMRDCAQRYGRRSLSTVFIGGGTPSLLPSDAIMHLLAMMRARFSLQDDAEITLEANPGTLTRAKLRDYAASGVNRLSLGMQAQQPRLLRSLGRIHTPEEVEQAVCWAREVSIDNLNLDLMYALPDQSMADWVETLNAALRLDPGHLSCYSLIVEPGTPMAQRVQRGEARVPDDDTVVEMQHACARILARRGYARYEISNYAKPGRACRHNLVYWTRGAYLGLGCAAHSFLDGERFANTSDLDAYLAGTREISRERVSPESAREEAIMLGTRMTEGIRLSLLPGKEKELERLRALGFLTLHENRVCLSEKGMDVQNAIVAQLI